MAYLGELKKLLTSITDFTPTLSISLIRRTEPDITEQLSKVSPKYVYSVFQTAGLSGRLALLDLVKTEPRSKVYQLRLITYPGTIRQANPDYIQNQMLTRNAFGLEIDIMMRKKLNPVPQIVLIGDDGLRRPSIAAKEFLTEQLKDHINGFNTERRRLKKPANLSPRIQETLKRDRIQLDERLQPAFRPATPRARFTPNASMETSSNIGELLSF